MRRFSLRGKVSRKFDTRTKELSGESKENMEDPERMKETSEEGVDKMSQSLYPAW